MSNFQEVLQQTKALRPGHTVFRSGGHANGWVEKGNLMRDPTVLDEVAAQQAAQIAAAFPQATLLVGAPACGAVVASFAARHLRLPVAYVLTETPLVWHRMYLPSAPQRTVYVDDLICTGEGTRSIVDFLRQQGHEVLGVSAWMSRSTLDLPLLTLQVPVFQTYAASDCSLCRAGVAVQWENVRE